MSVTVTSPRTTIRMFTDKSNMKDMKNDEFQKLVLDLSKNLNILLRAGIEIGKKGNCKINDKEYSKKEYNQIIKSVSNVVKNIPLVTKRVNINTEKHKKTKNKYTEEQQKEIVDALKYKYTKGAEGVTKYSKLPEEIKDLFIENSLKKLDSLNVFPSLKNLSVEKPFYISDPLRKFFNLGMFGNGYAFLYKNQLSPELKAMDGAKNPSQTLEETIKELGFSPVDVLGITHEMALLLADPHTMLDPLLYNFGISTSPILMSLMSIYIRVNDLYVTEDNKKKIKFDGLMNECFGKDTNIKYVFNSEDLGGSSDRNISGIERLQERDGGTKCDGVYFTRSMSIVLLNYYRIKKELVTEEMIKRIDDSRINELCNGTKYFL